MDRRNNSETGHRPAEDHLRKALGVIIESYKGADPERLYSEAILCFDALIDISLNTEAIRDFASRNNIDIKYLVDGANFVISKMHFNPEDNFYITLGVAQDAGIDDIRDRWKRLMLLYHPDRQKGGNEWVSERAKKVNEAYTELKDNSKRSAFDRKLAMQTVRATPAQRDHTRTMPVSKHRHPTRPHETARWVRTKQYLPKALIVLYLTAAIIFLLFKYYQNDSPGLENEFLSNHSSTPQPPQDTGDRELKSLKDDGNIHNTFNTTDKDIIPGPEIKDPLIGPPTSSSVSLGIDKKTLQAGTRTSLAPTADFLKERSFSVQQDGEKMHSLKDVSQKQTTLPLIASAPVASTNSSFKKEPSQPKLSEQIYERPDQKNDNTQAGNRMTGSQARDPETKAEVAHTMVPQNITKKEVEIFIQKYISAYRKNDLGEFMSLFSHSALENNTSDYNDIQKAYKKTFAKKISNYDVKDMDIRIDGGYALITGSYHANRFISSEDRWVTLSGNIRWKLAKEDNILKIMSINYDK